MAVCWWDVAKAGASNCRVKPSSPPSTVTRLGRPVSPRVHPAREESLPSAHSHQKLVSYMAVCWWDVAKAGASNCRIKPSSPPPTVTRLGQPISPRVHPGERREPSFSPFTPKASMLYGGLLVGGRQGWSQRLQGQAVFTPVDCDPSRPADLAQSAPRREKRAFLQPFHTKS
jgi:hypothetical protein